MGLPFRTWHFLFFVVWLLSVPMEGPLLTGFGAAGSSRWFLMTHVAVMVSLARWSNERRLQLFANTGAVLTVLTTLALPSAGAQVPLVMALIGVTAAPMAVRSCRDLIAAPHPTRAAAWCLVVANLLLVGIQSTADFPLWSTLIVILPLATISRTRLSSMLQDTGISGQWTYLAFVFIFQIVSGLMYGFLYPAYAEQAFLPGLELPFYMTAVLLALLIYQRDRDLLLAGGLSLAMLAFALLFLGGVTAINLSMFAMQGAAGCLDLFLLALLLESDRSVATFSYGLAVFCGGIVAGQFLSQALGTSASYFGLAGGLLLNVGALSLFLQHHRQLQQSMLVDDEPVPVGSEVLPMDVRQLLSERETLVLTKVMAGMNYREIASRLAISESSVKTYIKRIYDKLGVSNRQNLFKRLGWVPQL